MADPRTPIDTEPNDTAPGDTASDDDTAPREEVVSGDEAASRDETEAGDAADDNRSDEAASANDTGNDAVDASTEESGEPESLADDDDDADGDDDVPEDSLEPATKKSETAEPVTQAPTTAGDETGSSTAAMQAEYQWYVLKVQSNREKSIRETLMRRIRREGLERYFGEPLPEAIVIPTEKVKETKGGRTRVYEHKLFPGYIMIHMDLNDDTWYLVRDTSGVGDFTGAAGKPIPMEPDEVSRLLHQEEEEEKQVKVNIDLSHGEVVKIKDGAFENFEGSIDTIDEASGRIVVLVEVFGRSTPVELEYWQVEKV